MNVDPNKDSWLKSNIRPLVTLIAFVTISLVILLGVVPEEVQIKLVSKYVWWAGGFITFYFGLRFFKR